MKIKRHLYLWHRWLGIVLCLFMALWFVSGVVMLYVGYPKLTPAEHLARLPVLDPRTCCISAADALRASGVEQPPATLRLTSAAGTPRYLLGYADGRSVAVDARSGGRIERVDAEQALASARQFDGSVAAHYREQVEEDTWSRSRALDGDRPLHVVQLDDAEQRLLYISSRSGAVVRDATWNERAWNWLGAWLHWLYAFRDSNWWTDIVIYLSLAATAMALLGQVVGVLRWRFSRPYRNGARTPYSGFARWHHVGGMLFGLVLIAWIFSGLMSMRPWHLFENQSTLSLAAYQGGALSAERLTLAPADVLQRMQQSGVQARELEWRMLAGTAYLTARDGAGRSRVLALEEEGGLPLQQLPDELLRNAARAMQPEGKQQVAVLQRYDSYYYAREAQSMYGNQTRPLPVLQVRFDDPAQTWLYLDPRSGAVVLQLDASGRSGRWLFNLLHSWDWQPLLERPLLREVLIIAFSLGGLAISLTGVVLGWRRLRRQRTANLASAARVLRQSR